MSQRELKALTEKGDLTREKRLRSGRLRTRRDDAMAEEDLSELEELQTQLQEARARLEAQSRELADAQSEAESARQRADELENELRATALQAELDRLRALETLREKFDEEREKLRDDRAQDGARFSEWKATADAEKGELTEQVRQLKEELEKARSKPRSRSRSGSSSEGHTPEDTGGRGPPTEPAHSGHTPDARDGHTHDDDVTPPGDADATASTGAGAGEPTTTTGGSTTGEASATTEAGIMQSVTRLLEAQRQMMTVQVQAMAAQSFPPLDKFTGEDCTTDEGSFERWIERFEERAKIAGWKGEQKLLQLKAHLKKTAEHAFRMMPDEEKADYDLAVKSLCQRFLLLDIEELRGLEFHQLVQEKRTVEQLGMELQKLARKAFPKMDLKEFDRLLKGRFYQALLPKWQRKLGAPKAAESFEDLFARARTFERHEQQFSANSASRSDTGQKGEKKRNKDESQSKPQANNEPKNEAATSQSSGGPKKRRGECYNCHERGHIAKYCPKAKESPGRSNSSNVSMLTTEVLENLSVEQLEQILAKSKLQAEKKLLEGETANVNALRGESISTLTAVGPVLHLDIEIEGVPVKAVVDSGAQSTVISRDLLHQVNRHMRKQGRSSPTLELPSITLYGKGGRDSSELCVTAQTDLQLSVDGLTVIAPVFVQPSSSIPCLLGTNVLPELGVRIVRANGQPLGEPSLVRGVPMSSRVCVVQSTYIPSRRATFIEAEMQLPLIGSDTVVFEPDQTELDVIGLTADDCLLTRRPDGHLWIPVENSAAVSTRLVPGTCIGTVSSVVNAPQSAESTPIVPEAQCFSVNAKSPERIDRLLEALKLTRGSLNAEQFTRLKKLIASNADVFALDDTELGHTDLVQHHVDTSDHPPIKQPVRRVPFIYRDRIAKMVASMEEQGVVEPSTSPWASPVVLVPKKDGQYRFCIDYRRLNSITRKDVYPLPRIDDILDTLGGMKFFSSLDLASGYWQIGMDDESRAKSAFITHRGLYEFTRMPFGMCNAAATFQRLMECVLSGMIWKSCFAYIDDVLVGSLTFDDHLDHLQEVFSRLRKAGLRLKARKCLFLREEVPYLGHIVTKHGIKPDPGKIHTVKQYPVPVDATQVRQFLGLTSYYRRFVPQFSRIAAPLHLLLKKDATFQWTNSCQEAFERLKELLVSSPVLAYPQFHSEHPFIVETDASARGLGAVLAQQQADDQVHPIAFASRSLTVPERNYAITELETLGLVWALKIFRAYLLGHRCIVFTDHAACTSLLTNQHPSPKLARWSMTIQELDLDIRHRSGKSNLVADALSRNPLPTAEILQIDVGPPPQCGTSDVETLQRQDEELAPIFRFLEDEVAPSDDRRAKRLALEKSCFEVIDGVLYHENPSVPGVWRIVVPKALRETLLKESHSGKFAGHFAERKLYATLRTKYWWDKMRSDVRKHCRSCLTCASRKGPGRAPRPKLQPIPVGGPFHQVGIDVLQLPLSHEGKQYAVVFMDYLTKWPEVFAVPDQKAETIARLFVEHVIARYGVPEHLLSDRGANFLSSLVQEVCKLAGTIKLNTSGYHPQCDGLVEKFNSTLVNMLSKSVSKYGRDWDQHLPYLLFAYRVAVQESTQMSPFYLLYGREPRVPTETALNQPRTVYQIDFPDYCSELVAHLSDAWALAHQNIEKAQSKQKAQYDKRCRTPAIKVGDKVMVYFPDQVKGKAWKLARPYHGPYEVLALTPTNAEVRLASSPQDGAIFVALDRIRICLEEMSDETWTGLKPAKTKQSSKKKEPRTSKVDESTKSQKREYIGPITRSMARNRQD